MTGAGTLEQLFLQILNMSFGGSVAILLVLLCRLVLARAPKRFSHALWALPLIRLLCPFTLESAASPLPVTADPIPPDLGLMQAPEIHTGLPALNAAVNGSLPAGSPATSANPLQMLIAIGTLLYLLGVLAMVSYGIVAYVRLRRQLAGAMPLEKGLYEAPGMPSAFVLGLFRPRIYLPAGLSGEERAHVLAHERAHLRRLDHVTRLLGFAALCLHWFNPLVWLALRLSARDMELSCDERVLREAGRDIRASYAGALLRLSTPGHKLPGAPLAFGESDAGARIKNVLRYRKPAFLLSLAAALLCLLAAACALVSRAQGSGASALSGTYAVQDILYASPVYSFSYSSPEDAPQYAIDADGTLLERGGLSSMDGAHASGAWVTLGTLRETAFDADRFVSLFLTPDYPEDFAPGAIAGGVQRAWALSPAEGGVQDALLLETEGGDLMLLLTSGALAGDEPAPARWLFALERDGAPFDTIAVERSIQETYALSAPVRCFAYYATPEAPDHCLVAWIAGEDMGYSVLVRGETADAFHMSGTLYRGAAVSGEPVLCGPHLGDDGHEIALDAILSNDPLLASVTRTAGGKSETQAVSGAPSLTVFAAVEGTMELTYGYRETAGTDPTAATDAAAGGIVPQPSPLPDRALIDTAEADIDGDGRKETVLLAHGPTSGLYSFQLYAYEEGALESAGLFVDDGTESGGPEPFARALVLDAGGQLCVRVEPQSGSPAERLYTVSVENGTLVLTCGDERFEALPPF